MMELHDFEQMTRSRLQTLMSLTDHEIALEQIEFEIHNAPHTPPRSLPAGKMAIYIFVYGKTYLKVGKVGTKSKARYTSQHYCPESSLSNLAKSIIKAPDRMGISTPSNVGQWIKENTARINILFPATIGIRCLTLAEAFLQFWLQPVYEGFDSQI